MKTCWKLRSGGRKGIFSSSAWNPCVSQHWGAVQVYWCFPRDRDPELLPLLGSAELLERVQCSRRALGSQPAEEEELLLIAAGENCSGFPRALLCCDSSVSSLGDEKLVSLVIWKSNSPVKQTSHGQNLMYCIVSEAFEQQLYKGGSHPLAASTTYTVNASAAPHFLQAKLQVVPPLFQKLCRRVVGF